MSSFGCVPLASVWPCARCVDAITSPSSSARHTPTATASCPIATWRKPGSSPARKRSSTCSSKRLIRSISRRKSLSCSSGSVFPFCSAIATESTIPVRLPHRIAPMRLAEQWEEIRPRLGLDWATARLTLTADAAQCDRAALILGPAAPGRDENRFHLAVTRGGEQLGTTPTLLQRMLARLDQEGVRGTLELAGADSGPDAAVARPSLAAEWNQLAARLPDDWSHLYGEVE